MYNKRKEKKQDQSRFLFTVVVEKPESPTVLGEADLIKEVEVSLKVTETFMLFELISTCVLQETDEAKQIIKRNAMYHEVKKYIISYCRAKFG